jgi:fibronectin-binding autotransporter adhesin
MITTPRLWNSCLRSAVIAAILPAAMLMLNAQRCCAGSGTWNTNPVDTDWGNAANWTPAVPNGPADTATFGFSNTTKVLISQHQTGPDRFREVSSIVFNPGASAYLIAGLGGAGATELTLSGAGVVNNSAIVQTFAKDPQGGGGGSGDIIFKNSAAAGSTTMFKTIGHTGDIYFSNNSTADHASFSNGPSFDIDGPAYIVFYDNSTAGNATFTNETQSGPSIGGATILSRQCKRRKCDFYQ